MKVCQIQGERVIRRVGYCREYYETESGYWTLNPQKGFVRVPLDSRALAYTLSETVSR